MMSFPLLVTAATATQVHLPPKVSSTMSAILPIRVLALILFLSTSTVHSLKLQKYVVAPVDASTLEGKFLFGYQGSSADPDRGMITGPSILGNFPSRVTLGQVSSAF